MVRSPITPLPLHYHQQRQSGAARSLDEFTVVSDNDVHPLHHQQQGKLIKRSKLYHPNEAD